MIKMQDNIMQIAPVDISEATKAVQETALILDESSEIRITNQPTYDAAGDFLKRVKSRAKELDDARKTITQPLDKAKKAVMDLFRDPMDLLAKAEVNIKRAMLTYSQEQERIRQEAERKAQEAAREEEARQRIKLEKQADKYEAKGDMEKAEYIRERAENIFVPRPIVPPQVSRVAGISERKVWQFRIVDVNQLPREYMIPDEKALGALARSTQGRLLIPGVEFYAEKTIYSGRG